MMRAAVAVLATYVITLAIVAHSQVVGLHRQQREIESLKATLATVQQPIVVSLAVQERCAKQARAEFVAEGENKRQLAEYTHHYSAKQNKCFVAIRDTDTKGTPGTIYVNEQIIDAFEGKVYATYLWRTDKAEKFWEVPPAECKVAMISGAEKQCQSRVEFDMLVRQYMDDDLTSAQISHPTTN